MTEVVYKPYGGDIFIGALVSGLASLTFLPVNGFVVLLISELSGLGSTGSTGVLVALSALTSILFFRILWNDSVKTRDSVDELQQDDAESVESSNDFEQSEE
jgi:hypothetical protein